MRDLRQKIKRTQAQFAKLVGVSRVYINKIENGQIQISPSLAARVHAATGINIEELVKGSEGKLIDLLGSPYEEGSFIRWRKRLTQPIEKNTTAQVRNFRWWTWILLRAAAVHHDGVAYNAVHMALFQSLSTIRRDFGLEETTDRLLRECEPPAKWLPGAQTPSEKRATNRELEKALAQAEAESQFRKRARVRWFLPEKSKPKKQRPSKKAKRRRS
jgi:transcriptional regulator with XRE-family HTH domain